MLCNTQQKKETSMWAGGGGWEGAIRVWSSFHSTLISEEFSPHIVVPVNNSASGFNRLSPYQTGHFRCDRGAGKKKGPSGWNRASRLALNKRNHTMSWLEFSLSIDQLVKVRILKLLVLQTTWHILMFSFVSASKYP